MGRSRIRNSVRRLRFNASEMTQQELAEKVGVTRQTVIAIEGDKYSPSLEVAFRIARVFGVPLEEVFQYQPEAGAGDPRSAAPPNDTAAQPSSPPEEDISGSS